MCIRYTVYLWSPPSLTPEQEIQVGRQIVLEGRETFLKRAPYLSEEDRRYAETAGHWPRERVILALVFAAIAVPIVVMFWLPLLFGLIPILIYSGGSLLHARARYHRWVDEMIAKYAASITEKPKEPPYVQSRHT